MSSPTHSDRGNGSGSSAPVGSAFVTIGNDATLTAERALAVAAGELTLADGGANAAVTLGLPFLGVAGTYAPTAERTVGLVVDAQGRITAAADQVIAIVQSQITDWPLTVARGGTSANLSATGGASQVLRQSGVGAAVTVSQLAFTDLLGTASDAQIPNTITLDNLTQITTRLHSSLQSIGPNDHHAQSHVLATTAGLGADHTTSGLTAGQVLRASGAATAAFAALAFSDLTGSATAGQVPSHDSLNGLPGGDVHTQYALLAGRASGQVLIGGTASGDDLTLHSTSHATKGSIFLGTVSAYDQTLDSLGLGILTPGARIHIKSDQANATLRAEAYGFNLVNYAGFFDFRAARGTAAIPANSGSGDTLFALFGIGYDTTNGFMAFGDGGWLMKTAEAFTSTAHGVDMALSLKAPGTNSVFGVLANEVWRFRGAGYESKTGMTGNPSALVNGDYWYSHTTHKSHRFYSGGVTEGLVGVANAAVADSTTLNGGTAGDQNFSLNYTLPVNALVVGKSLRITWSGKSTTAGIVTMQFKIKAGATTLLDFGALTVDATGVANLPFCGEAMLTCRSVGAAGAQLVRGLQLLRTAALVTLPQAAGNTGTPTINTAATQQLQVSVAFAGAGAGAGDVATLQAFMVEVMD